MKRRIKARRFTQAGMKIEEMLGRKSLVLILAYAPAGLGHLRVTDALYEGLPPGVNPLLLGAHDKALGTVHRMMSVHPAARMMMEWVQKGWMEDVFTRYYRKWLRRGSGLIYEQLTTIMEQRMEVPKTVLVVCTHFGLAHQLAAIKGKLEKEKEVKVILVTVVTDDSPLHVWYVPGADLTFVPSELTKTKLLEYGRKAGLEKIRIKVRPYPVNPNLAERLTSGEIKQRRRQVKGKGEAKIEVVVPISGAAVGLKYYQNLMDELHEKSERFNFRVISKTATYTKGFLQEMLKRAYVRLEVSDEDREVVEKYEQVYKQEVISLEITKPSEQAFKALLNPGQRGGAVVLFTRPVGRQEWDNLDYLRRHGLTATRSKQRELWKWAEQEKGNWGGVKKSRAKLKVKRWREEIRQWRGIRIPNEPKQAAEFIWWGIEQGLFAEMMKCCGKPVKGDRRKSELGDDGVRLIWEEVGREVEKE
jgi:hypothetical protein